MRILLLAVCTAVFAAAQPAAPLHQTFSLSPLWRVQTGDDLRWAAADYDDSAWPVEPPRAGQDGFVWYRQTVDWPALEGPLALWMPNVVSAAEVYLNGTLALRHGEVDRWWTHRRDALPPIPIPAAVRKAPRLTVAIRVRQFPWAVGMSGVPRLGSPESVDMAYQVELLRVYRYTLFPISSALLPFLTALAAALYWRGRRDRIEYAWFALLSAGSLDWALENARALGATQAVALGRTVITIAGLYGAWRFFSFGLENSWLARRRAVVPIALTALFAINYAGRANHISYLWINPVGVIVYLASLAVNTHDARQRRRNGDREILWLLVPYAVTVFGELAYAAEAWAIAMRGQQTSFAFAGGLIKDPYRITLTDAGLLTSWVAIAVVLARRLLRVVAERQELSSELEAARQVQELLLPGADLATPGFMIERAYLPARRVGGDFYHLRALKDGGVLVAVGDVSGKGLKAAMLVSVAIGILRNEKSDSPGAVLAALNNGLVGHTGGGFVTCCCARFDVDGQVTMANAGHPSPYCDGHETPVEAELPLGVVAGVEYAQSTVGGSSFTFVSDGVVEAENAQRELFGFDRTREIVTKSAAEIAEVARAWGQNDDITVVTVRRSQS